MKTTAIEFCRQHRANKAAQYTEATAIQFHRQINDSISAAATATISKLQKTT
jgi:hypothetical protein